MQSGLDQLIAAEKRLDDVVAASKAAAEKLVEDAREKAAACAGTRREELERKSTEVKQRARADRDRAIAALEESARLECEVYDRLDDREIDRLAALMLERVLDSLKEEVDR
jgi:hypothetical protein